MWYYIWVHGAVKLSILKLSNQWNNKPENLDIYNTFHHICVQLFFFIKKEAVDVWKENIKYKGQER